MKVTLENGLNGKILMNVAVEGNSVTKYMLKGKEINWQGNRAILDTKEEAIKLIAEMNKKGYETTIINKIKEVKTFVTRTCSLIIM